MHVKHMKAHKAAYIKGMVDMAGAEGSRGRGRGRSERGRGRGRGPGGRRRQVEPVAVTTEELKSWFAGGLPDDWFTEPAAIIFDRDEILVTGDLPAPKVGKGEDQAVANEARVETFRSETRDQRMAIAERAQQKYERTVSWAVTCGDHAESFTTVSAPVMSRLLIEERAILDTLIAAGVARSRSEALAWCVRLVAQNESDWLASLRDAMKAVEEARAAGPDAG